MVGQTISHYRVTAKIGAGGMGEVYSAIDTKLNREVAIKILPAAFASDHDRMARFDREARVLASLHHPNIASIFGIEESNGIRCLILELVKGETLSERIAAGPLPVEEALRIAVQIAEAIEAAHERGIVHRDLKPANVKLTRDGAVKVLDFGLAKALEDELAPGDLAQSPTLSAAASRAGVILGTAAYMSPEQAKGKAVDRRTDIWSFGIVLFEMLTRKQLFAGETVSDILAAVIMGKIEWGALPASTPPGIRELLARCLRRDPRSRLRDIGDARVAIEEVLTGTEPIAVPVPAAARGGRWGRTRVGIGFLAVAALACLLGWMLKPAGRDLPLRKFEIPLADANTSLGAGTTLALSPDGARLAYTSEGQLWLRELNRLEPRALLGTEGAAAPFWSPDGAWLAFGTASRLLKMPATGGEPSVLCGLASANFNPSSGGAWGRDGKIVFCVGDGGLFQVSAQGGDPLSVLEPEKEKEVDFHNVTGLPDGKGYLFVVHRKQGYDTIDLFARGKRKTVIQLEGQSVAFPSYSPTGHILYHRTPVNPGVWALPFSLARLEAAGQPFLVVPEGHLPSSSGEGTIAFLRGARSGLAQLVWVNREGLLEGTIGQPEELDPFPELSPDGIRVAIPINHNETSDIWIHDAVRGTKTRLTFSDLRDVRPAWSPSGDRIYFAEFARSDSFTVMERVADGSGDARALTSGFEASVSPDGRFLVFDRFGVNGTVDLWYLALLDGEAGEQPGEPVRFLATPAFEFWPRVSPDGRYLAYVSNESGRPEVYIRRFPSGGGKWQVSVSGGHWPRWSQRGDELFYVEGDKMIAVPVETEPTLVLGQAQVLFTREPSGIRLPFGWADGYDVTADGRRFVVVRSAEKTGERNVDRKPGITLVQNWFAEFRGKQ